MSLTQFIISQVTGLEIGLVGGMLILGLIILWQNLDEMMKVMIVSPIAIGSVIVAWPFMKDTIAQMGLPSWVIWTPFIGTAAVMCAALPIAWIIDNRRASK